MKLSKILMTVAAAAALVGFAGCKGADEDPHKIISIKGDTATIEYESEADVTYRGFKTLKTKHTDAVCVFTIDTNESKTDWVSDRAGVLGFVFDLQKNTSEDTYNFSAVSVRWNGSDLQSYISRFTGVNASDMDGLNNFKDKNGIEIGQPNCVATEESYLAGVNTAYATISGISKDSDGLVKVAVRVRANTESKKYEVEFFDANAVLDAPGKEYTTTDEFGNEVKAKDGQIDSNATPKTITNADSNHGTKVYVDPTWSIDVSKKQQLLGFYAAVYPKCTLVGSIQLPYILNEDEVVEWDD